MREVLHKSRTDFNDIEVTREGDVITLWSKGVRQTAISTGSPLPLIESSRNMLLTLAFPPRPRRALVLGLGGGSVARMLLAAHPDLTVEAVEIDPAMAAIARKHFGLRPSPRLRLTLGDASAFVIERVGEAEFDLALVDPYLGNRFALDVAADATLARLHRSLTASGVLVVNFFSGQPRVLEPALDSLRHRFRSVLTLAGTESRNVLVFAAKDVWRPADLVRSARRVEAEMPLEFRLGALAGRVRDATAST